MTPEAGRYLGLSGRTLEKHRYFGTGPVYYKIGGRVVYKIDDLDAWVLTHQRLSTCNRDDLTDMPFENVIIGR